MRSLWAAVIALLLAAPVAAQNARDGRLLITVADQTGAVIPGAAVTLIFQDAQNAPPITTDRKSVV